jgi:hypothetical protein
MHYSITDSQYEHLAELTQKLISAEKKLDESKADYEFYKFYQASEKLNDARANLANAIASLIPEFKQTGEQ